MAAATTDFARIGATIDPSQKLDPEQVNHMAKIGIKIHQTMTKRLDGPYAKASTIAHEIVNAAKSSREGDHPDGLLENYKRFFATWMPENTPSIIDESKPLLEWFSGLSRLDLIGLLNTFRSGNDEMENRPPNLRWFHEIHCDAFESYLGSTTRGAGTSFNDGLDVIDILHFVTKTSNATMHGFPPPPRPLNLITMLLGNLVAIKPVWTLLINLQHVKDNRQGTQPPEGVTVYPDQTVLCDFFVWGHAFFTYLNTTFKACKSKPGTALGVQTPTVADPIFGPELEMLLSKSVVPVGAPRRDVRGTFVVHQQPLWLTVPSSKSGLKFKPWAVDLVIASEPNTPPIRVGKLPYFTNKPGWTGQLVAMFENCDKHKYQGRGALLSSLSFASAPDTLAAWEMVAAPPLGMGCNTNVTMDAMICQRELVDNAFTLSRESTQVAKLDKNDHTEIYWQLHAEPMSRKGGKITLEYLKFWYSSAAAFFKAKPWTKCPYQTVIEVFANGVGRRNVAIGGSDGTPTALRLFKVGKRADFDAEHDACVFTSPANCAFADLKMIEDYQLEVADELGHPSLFSGFNTFKRPPFAELELFRVCFDLFTAYFADRTIGPENMLDQAKWLKTDHDVLVLDDAKPVRCEVIVPPSLYREEPETIEVTEIDQGFLEQAASPELCQAYDAALAAFTKDGGKDATALTLGKQAATINMKVAAFMLAQRKIPAYTKLKQATPDSPIKVLNHQAAAYCVRSLDAWRGVQGALAWLEEQVHAAFPLPARIVKCGYGVCNRAGTPREFNRCSACKSILYCCAKCQKSDWPSHKLNCKRLKAEAAAASAFFL